MIKEFKSSPTSNAKQKTKKTLETEITCRKLSNVFLSLIN